jgi:sugar-specific transcriptional regulator TrmB
MLIKNELIKKVKDYFDLNIYETKVWLALLQKGHASAGEIAELSGVPRSRTYDVLESLEKRGFAIEKLGKPVKYMAVRPNVVIEKLKNNTMKEADEKLEVLSNLKGTTEFEELEQIHKDGIEPIKNHELTASIRGRANLYTQLVNAMESAENFIYFATSKEELDSKEKLLSNIFAKLKKRKINVKVIISDSPEDAKQLSEKFNISIKHKELSARFLIVDGKEIIFTMSPTSVHEDFDYGVWINSEYFASSLTKMFELAWKE